jgi:hypothetical protein
VSSTGPSGEVPDLQYALLNDRTASSRNDCLDTREAASELADILLASRQNSPFVLAVYGDWGVGKKLAHFYEQLPPPKAFGSIWFSRQAQATNALAKE